MLFRACALLCVLFVIGETEAFAKRDVSSQPNDAVVSLQKNLDNFRRCLDQSLATAVGDVNEKHLQPVFSVIGDSLNRVSKAVAPPRPYSGPEENICVLDCPASAFEDLTATTKKPDPDLDF